MAGPVELRITNNNLPLLSQLDALIKERLLVALEQIGLLLEKGAVLAIQNQVAPDGTTWEALADWYVEWKRKQGFSDQIYIMSSSYIQAIAHKVENDTEEMTVVAGVMRDAGMEPGKSIQGELFGTDIWKVAEILEYGWDEFDVKVAPRPLWRPLLEVSRRSIQTRIGMAIARATQIIAAQARGKVERE